MMTIVDDRGRLFGRVNVVDLAIAIFALFLVPVAFASYLLFRTPAAQIASVTQVPVSREERRVAGGSYLSAKLKVRGSGLRPMLRATIDSSPTLGFVFETPNAADVLVGLMPAGVHDLVLWDGVQEVARAPKSVVIQALPPARVRAVGTLLDMDRQTAESLRVGAAYPNQPSAVTEIAQLGAVEPARHRMVDPLGRGAIDVPVPDRWERGVVMLLRCDPDSGEGDCAVGGTSLTAGPAAAAASPEAITYTRALTIPWTEPLRLMVDEILPSTPPQRVTVRVRLAGAAEVLALVAAGDRDLFLDDRAAIVTAIGSRGGDGVGATLALGADRSRDGWRYRGRPLVPGAAWSLRTGRYAIGGTVVSVNENDGAK